MISPATAVHDDGFFELGLEQEADILDNNNSGLAGVDWESLFDVVDGRGVPKSTLPAPFLRAAFLQDDLSAKDAVDDTKFAGSNKNPDPYATYEWDTGNVPAKDDLGNVYTAAAFSGGDLIIYAGLERIEAGGDSHVDIEYNRRQIGLDKTPPCGADGVPAGDDPPCEFTGERSVNDLLVSMDFTRGGDLGSLTVRKWNGASFDVVASLSGEGANADDTVAGFNNGVPIDGGPWDNFDRGGNVVLQLEKNAFTEFGVNVTKLLGGTPCFSSVMAKTRSSQSFTAELKDFAPPAPFALCAISVAKVGPALSKIGDNATYRITVTNTGVATLFKQSIIDDKLGNLTSEPGCGSSLAPGASCTVVVTRPIPPDASDPFINTVNVVYDSQGDLLGDEVTASAQFSTNLFQPSYTLSKGGTALSKIGDTATYTYSVQNTSSSDSPPLELASITDDRVGDLVTAAAPCALLSPGATCSFSVTHIIPAGASDPYVNTVSARYRPRGFPNNLDASASHSTNLFQPNFAITKSANRDRSKIGDEVIYTFRITNTGSADSPALNLVSINDNRLGVLTGAAGAAGCGALPVGASCTFTAGHVIPIGADDPYVNTVTATYQVAGFPNQLTSSAVHSLNLFQPSFTLVKQCGPSPVPFGGVVTYTFTITNTSSPDSPALSRVSVLDSLLGDISADFPASLAPGASATVTRTRTVLSTDPNPLVNHVTATYQVAGFPNRLSQTASCSVNIQPPQGCTPGYWKTHPERWDGVGTDDFVQTDSGGSPLAPFTTGDFFNAVFGVTSTQSGLSNSVTLLDAMSVSGGDLMALNRHATAGLISAAMSDSQVAYPFSVAQVIGMYRDAVGADAGPETIASALAKLEAANNQPCPLN